MPLLVEVCLSKCILQRGLLYYFISILLNILITFVITLMPLSETSDDILTPALDFIARWIPRLQILAFPLFRIPKGENWVGFHVSKRRMEFKFMMIDPCVRRRYQISVRDYFG